MKASRKKNGRAGGRGHPHWHAVEVAVPEPSRLSLVAGGMAGREPPRASRLVEAIAAACRLPGMDGAECPPTWLVAPSRRVGNEWLETLARTGRPTANLHVTTMSALAYDIVSSTLARDGVELAPPRAKLVAVERILQDRRDDLRSFAAAESLPRLAERILQSLEALRDAGLAAPQVARGLRNSAKGRDLALLLDRYEAMLREMRLIDRAGEVSLALDHVRTGSLPPGMQRLLVPDDLDLPRLEGALLEALEASPAIDVRRLETDPPLDDASAAVASGRLQVFRAAGEGNEVRFVLRTCLRLGLRLDEVEIVHTDPNTYPSVVREIVAALPRPERHQASAGDEDVPPVTFAEGLPLADSRPGRALSAWLSWRRDGHPQSGLEHMLREGLIDLRRTTPDAPRPASLVRELRGVRIGRGLDRAASLLSAAVARVRDRPAASFLHGERDDDPGEDAGAVGEELLAHRKQRHWQRLTALEAFVTQLAACEGGRDGVADAVLRGARTFVDVLCPADSEFDGNARRVLLDEIDAMLHWQGGRSTLSAADALGWLERLPAELVVLGSGPRPGCLHVSGLAGGGHSGRPCTFVLGLDENRFPGAGSTDPVLTDGDRSLLNAAQPDARLAVAHDAAGRNTLAWRRLLGRLRGSVWLGYSCLDTAEDAEMFPSPALLALHAEATGDPLATVADLVASLPPPETFVPADPELALDESQWWLAALGPQATAADVDAALAAHRDHLGHGTRAVAARRSDAFTPHDGSVPEAGPLLDPRLALGRTASPHSLEALGGCPRRFFYRYGLGVEPVEVFDDDTDRWLNPLDAGSLLHTVLERFMRRIIDRGELPQADRHLDELLAVLDEELAVSRRRHPPLTEPAFAARRDELRVAMSTFLHDEERSCREHGLRPVAIEAAIGMEPAATGTPFDCRDPVAVELAPGETITLRGRIDRIDVRGDAAGPAYTLWDYKSGSGYGFPASAADDPFDRGRKLQHGLYVVMLRARLADPRCTAAGGTVERFGYFFPTRAGKGRRLTWTGEQLADCTRLVRQLADIARQGAFLPTSDPADCSHCDFAAACGDPARVTGGAARMLATSPPLAQLFAGLRGQRRPAQPPEVRRPDPRPPALTPHPPPADTPPDEPVRRRIREDLGTTLLVEAAAGTGKTTCMVERMLALVRSGAARPEGIVAVTFTKKAAGELRRRFRERLQRAAATAAAEPERSRLAAAIGRIDSMVIGTIHSFAGRLLRERPLEAGVDPGFRELDEVGDRLLRRQAWRDFVTAAPTDHAELLAGLDRVGLRLGDLGRLFIERFATYGDVEAWPVGDSPAPDTAALLPALEAFVSDIEAAEFPPTADRGTDELMNSLEQFARMFRRIDPGSIVAVMDVVQELDRAPKVTQAGWPGAGGTDAEVKAARKAAATRWQEAWDDIRTHVAVPALWRWRAHRYPVVIATLRAALAAYDRLRAARGVLSFQDLLCKAAALLAGSADVRRSFRARYTHILVDEFQDTDPVQAQLLLLLTATDPDQTDWRHCEPAAGSLFVVGDPKQSLYRFRRADIVTYSAVRSIVERHGDVLALTTNFRSRGDLVTWTNDVFSREFPAAATPESPSFTAGTSGRREAQADGPGAAWLAGVRGMRFVRAGHAGDAWAEEEARQIAACIRQAIDAGMRVPRTADEAAAGLDARCRPGDFLIVARERRHLGTYAAALHAVGLPVDVTGTLGADQSEPLWHLRTCLAAIADPDDGVAMLALLRGAVFGFSDADLHAYAAAGGRFGGGIDVPDAADGPLRQRLAVARDAVRRWRRWMRHLPVAAAIERLIDDAGLLLIAAADDGAAGPRGRAVAGLLQHYVERLRADRLQVVSAADCLDLLDDMIDDATRAEFDPLSIDVPSADRVRVMNLHKAKGLESPVVFLADYQCRAAGDAAEDGPFLHIDRSRDRTEGWLAVTTPIGRGRRIIAAPPDWPALCARERAFEQAEQIRLDYVAATRAGACLVVSLFEKHDPGTKSRREAFSAEGAWARFGQHMAEVPDLPEPRAGVARPAAGKAARHAARDSAGAADRIRERIAACMQRTFARISPRELLTEPAEGIRFTGDGLGEPWGRAIHRLLELAAHDPGLDLAAAAAVVLSNEEVSPVHVDRAVETVWSVMRSDLWRRAQASDARHVEVPFSVQVRGEDLPERVRRLAGKDGPPVPTVVRGVIDLVFREADGRRWTVVDWKTDAVAAASEPLLESHYRPQVELYADCWSLLAYNQVSGDTR
jgi:ATP-dependent helicase/nuclease subunit A